MLRWLGRCKSFFKNVLKKSKQYFQVSLVSSNNKTGHMFSAHLVFCGLKVQGQTGLPIPCTSVANIKAADSEPHRESQRFSKFEAVLKLIF